MLKTLESFGLARKDAEVYVYLAKTGPQKVTEIINSLKIRKRQVYPILKNLQRRGMVTVSLEKTTFFSALAFEKTLDLLVKDNIEQAKIIKEIKEELVSRSGLE